LHVDWVGWSVRVGLGLLWFESLLRLVNNGQRTAAASLLVFGLTVAAVEGEFWSGFFARDFDTESEAWAFVDALKGKTLLVNYRPDNHEVSVLTDSSLRAAIPDPSVLRERRWLRFPVRPG